MNEKSKRKSICADCGRGLRKRLDSENINEPIVINPRLHPKPELLYKRVLEIGSENILKGISFNELFHILKYHENFSIEEDSCLERCLREWFWNSFFHEEAHCLKNSNVNTLDEHLDCSFILNADSCIKLMSFKESENNKKATETNIDIARKSLQVANLSLFIALFTMMYPLISDRIYQNNLEKKEQEKKEKSNDLKKSFAAPIVDTLNNKTKMKN